jgi:hypothetical protein
VGHTFRESLKAEPGQRMGIVRDSHWLLWGYGYGFMIGAPNWLKRFIVMNWNRVTCRIWRHWQFQDVCVMCCKKMELP